MQHKTHSAQTLDTTQLKILEISLEGQIASSGPSYSINRLVKELIALQINVRLGGLSWRNLQEIEEAPSFATMFLCARAFSRLGASPTMRKWINNAVASNTANIIHCHSIWLMPPVYSSRAAFRQNIPFVVSPRGTLSKWAFESGSRLKPLFGNSFKDRRWNLLPAFTRLLNQNIKTFAAMAFDSLLQSFRTELTCDRLAECLILKQRLYCS